jgi:hypothetical protein
MLQIKNSHGSNPVRTGSRRSANSLRWPDTEPDLRSGLALHPNFGLDLGPVRQKFGSNPSSELDFDNTNDESLDESDPELLSESSISREILASVSMLRLRIKAW